jgi:hypothetical protein
MGIYLGDSGHVELQRASLDGPLHGTLDGADVNEARKRFSFDLDHSALITGDKIEIRTQDGSDLQLVAGHAYPDWTGYINIDDAGGISLYATFGDALTGNRSHALPLQAPTTPQPISVHTAYSRYRCLANISSYELTTNRETVDITSLGEEFRNQYTKGLISGQGTLNCLWNYKASLCDGTSERMEFPHYLAQLCILTQQGADFQGRFYLDTSTSNSYLWYEAACVITNVATTFDPGQVIRSTVQFVTTGPVRLHMGMPPAYLLQESGDLILQEDGSPLLLEDP